MRYWIILLFCSTSLAAQTSPAFHVDVQGSGAPLVLIPGLACSGEVWAATLEELSTEYECHVVTLPGFAGQPAIDLADGFLEPIWAELIGYLDDLAQPATLIGHSLGGFSSLAVALQRPDLVKRLVIVDSYPFYSAAMQPGITVEQVRGQADFMRQSMLQLDSSSYALQQRQMMPILVRDSSGREQAVKWGLASDRPSVAQAMYELMTTDLRAQLTALEVPTLVMGAWASGRDYGLTQDAVQARLRNQYAAAKMPVQIAMAAEAYHFIMLDEPIWFMAQLQQFLQGE